MIYSEIYRPQFHFTSKKNWINDPNGLVHFGDTYHLFFQHNPDGIQWGNMTWGHAVSHNLIHWTQLDHTLYPDALGTIFSGSAIVDWKNSSSLGNGKQPPIVLFYTSAGSEPPPFTQSMAFSRDGGRTWTKYENNPIIENIVGQNRDPKVVWDNDSNQWLMALYLENFQYCILSSQNLINWAYVCDLELPGVTECPDLIKLPLDGYKNNMRWIFWGANGGYRIGHLDQGTFIPESELLFAEMGPNGYAAQTWSDIPEIDGRCIQMSWMRNGKYPGMPFNQQMSIPVQLSLETTPLGIRLCRRPIKEIFGLYNETVFQRELKLTADKSYTPHLQHDLLDFELILDMGDAAVWEANIQGNSLRYRRETQQLTFGETEIMVPLRDNKVDLRLILDRTSLEIFAIEGSISASFCFLPEKSNNTLYFQARGGKLYMRNFNLRTLNSIWQ